MATEDILPPELRISGGRYSVRVEINFKVKKEKCSIQVSK